MSFFGQDFYKLLVLYKYEVIHLKQYYYDKDYLYGNYQKSYYEQISEWDDENIQFQEEISDELNCFISEFKHSYVE